MLITLQVNIPFCDALEQILVYTKFMNNKHKWKDDKNVVITEEYGVIIQHKLPHKLTDPGRFMIPCFIGSLKICHALYDLGASINLMSLSMMRKLNCGEPKPTKMTLTLVDRSFTYPYGVLEDILVKVDDLLFLANFVILDMPEDAETPLLLRRHFLATGRALIDAKIEELILWFNKEQVIFCV